MNLNSGVCHRYKEKKKVIFSKRKILLHDKNDSLVSDRRENDRGAISNEKLIKAYYC